MNICMLCRESPLDGGIGAYTEKTSRALAKRGHTVTVITETLANGSVDVEQGVHVHKLPRAGLNEPWTPPYTWTLSRARRVALALRSLPVPPDVVQACEWESEALWYALGMHSRTRLVTRFATPFSLISELQDDVHPIRDWCFDWMERIQTYASDGIISPSACLADLVCRRWRIPRRRVTIMPTGVDFADQCAPGEEIVTPDLDGCEYLLYFGRLERRKGIHILANALGPVLEAHRNLHFVFAGGDYPTFEGQPVREYIQACSPGCADRLHFFPTLAKPQLYTLLSKALFVVLPSLWESLSNATLEAIDMGKPVVATQGCGFGEVIEDGQSGVLVPPGDADALAHAMLWLLADRQRLCSMSAAAKVRAEAFHLTKTTGNLERFYERLLARPMSRMHFPRQAIGRCG